MSINNSLREGSIDFYEFGELRREFDTAS